MPIEVLSNDYALVFLGPKQTSGQWNRPDEVMDYLFEALDVIRTRLREETVHRSDRLGIRYVIDISRTYRPDYDDYRPSPRAPIDAWMTLASYRSLHGRLREWIGQLDLLVAEAIPERYGYTLWEGGDHQLGEVAAQALAVTDKSFVPFYVRMLRVWNCVPAERGTYIDDVIAEIVGEHGLCPETEELIECAYTAWGYEGYDLPRLLKELHDDLPNYPLFRRIVVSQNEWFANCKSERYRAIMERLRENPDAPVAGRAGERWVFRDDEYSGIWDDADIVLAELDAAALGKS